MTTLSEQMQSSFARVADEHITPEGFQRLVSEDDDLAPGFTAMVNHYEEKVKVWARRGYRFYAGSTLPTDSDVLLELTKVQMRMPLVRIGLSGFADGVQIGYAHDQVVRMAVFFGAVDSLFDNVEFRENSETMVTGYTEDPQVVSWFGEFFDHGLDALSHMVGFAHQEVEPNQVWDVWISVGQAATGTAYLAGLLLGQEWQQRDVLDGIELASELIDEEVSDAPDGEGDSDS